METRRKIEAFATAAHSLFVIGGWKWFLTNSGPDQVPTVEDIQNTCWVLLHMCEESLYKTPSKLYTVARTGRITCNLTRGDSPNFTLDITPRT